MRNLLVLLVLIFSLSVGAQERATVTGKVTDKEMNDESLPFANVFIKGTTIGTTTDFDGNYTLSLEEGEHVIVFSFVGYAPAEQTITVEAGMNYTVNQAVGASEGVLMDEVIVKASVSRESASALLAEQKKAVVMTTAIGAQELSRKGVSDASAAVAKISGVSKQEGSGGVFVRGLGDRYNITTLNGLPLPSNNPSNKNIDLSIFTTDVVEAIDVSKTFETKNFGDFGGANINIKSKNFRGQPYVKVGVGAGINSNVVGLSNFYLQDGPSATGFGKQVIPESPTTPLNYTTSWDRVNKNNQILNNGFALSAGRAFDIGEEGRLSAFITASHKTDTGFRTGIERGGVDAQGDPVSDFLVDSYGYDTKTTLMGSLNYKIDNNNSIAFNSLFLNSTEQDYSEYRGNNEDFDGGVDNTEDNEFGIIQRGTFDRTQLLVNQILGSHDLSEAIKFEWAAGSSNLKNDIPDRMQNTFVPSRVEADKYTFFSNSAIDNHRYYQELTEDELSANALLTFKFAKNSNDDFKGKVKAGYSGRFKNVAFESNQFDFNVKNDVFNFVEDDINNVDNYLNEDNFYAENYNINQITQKYFGDQFIHAFLTDVQYGFSEKFTAVVGLRVESIYQSIGYITTLEPEGKFIEINENQFLPSFSGKYSLTDLQSIKFAGSKTYTLPQQKEKVKMLYEEVTQAYIGNPDLYSSSNYNIDIGWEIFPGSGELVSVTGFGKMIQNPINEVFINSASGEISYLNSGDLATVLGLELEVKKKLFEYDNSNDMTNKLSMGLNLSLMNSNQDYNADKVSTETDYGASFTYEEGRLTGASDIIGNADVSYLINFSEDKNVMTTVSYGYFSDKLKTIGTQGKGHLVDQSNSALDFVVKSELNKRLQLGLAVKNILDPTYLTVQETQNVVINSYKKGVDFSLSLSYKF